MEDTDCCEEDKGTHKIFNYGFVKLPSVLVVGIVAALIMLIPENFLLILEEVLLVCF